MPVVELVGADRFPLLQIKPIPPGGNRDITELPQLVFPLSGPFKYPGHGINRSVGPLQLVQKIQIPAALGQNRHTVLRRPADAFAHLLIRGQLPRVQLRVTAAQQQARRLFWQLAVMDGAEKTQLRPCFLQRPQIFPIIKAERLVHGHCQAEGRPGGPASAG